MPQWYITEASFIMKKQLKIGPMTLVAIVFVSCIIVLLSGCKKQKDEGIYVTTYDATEITENSALLRASVSVQNDSITVTELGVCISTSKWPTTTDLHYSTTVSNRPYRCTVTDLQPNTTYHVRAYVVCSYSYSGGSLGIRYGADKTFRTFPLAYVDFGLPSGTLWSTVNLGAEWPEEYGDYFAWGEISTKNYFDWSTYDYSTGNNHYLTKYCTVSSYGRFDNKVYLEVCDDAATEIWGEGWCIPTKAQWEELRRYTSRTITYEHGVQGMRFTRYGESIFLPFAGCYLEDELMDKGDDGYYWSNQIERDSPDCAWYFELPLEGRRGAGYRSYGQSIRPVWNPR